MIEKVKFVQTKLDFDMQVLIVKIVLIFQK